jgi:hypothetical protein
LEIWIFGNVKSLLCNCMTYVIYPKWNANVCAPCHKHLMFDNTSKGHHELISWKDGWRFGNVKSLLCNCMTYVIYPKWKANVCAPCHKHLMFDNTSKGHHELISWKNQYLEVWRFGNVKSLLCNCMTYVIYPKWNANVGAPCHKHLMFDNASKGHHELISWKTNIWRFGGLDIRESEKPFMQLYDLCNLP